MMQVLKVSGSQACSAVKGDLWTHPGNKARSRSANTAGGPPRAVQAGAAGRGSGVQRAGGAGCSPSRCPQLLAVCSRGADCHNVTREAAALPRRSKGIKTKPR